MKHSTAGTAETYRPAEGVVRRHKYLAQFPMKQEATEFIQW